jgi:hypothetical protein
MRGMKQAFQNRLTSTLPRSPTEAQVDWYEGWAEFDGERRKMQLFCLRSMASGGAFHRAYPRANQQAFLEAHELGFAYFGGFSACYVTTT